MRNYWKFSTFTVLIIAWYNVRNVLTHVKDNFDVTLNLIISLARKNVLSKCIASNIENDNKILLKVFISFFYFHKITNESRKILIKTKQIIDEEMSKCLSLFNINKNHLSSTLIYTWISFYVACLGLIKIIFLTSS